MKFPVLVIALSTLLQAATPSDTCNQNMWVTNGPVYAIAPAGNKVYIGGQFTQVGPYTGGGVPINSSTGTPVPVFPKINGTVNAVCADGNGGWIVGGRFTSVGGVARNNIAHILSGGSVDLGWNPNANSEVYSLAVSGATVYAGGNFDTIGGLSRSCIAALDVTTGNPLAWNPNAGGNVNSIIVSGTTVYAGGTFDNIGGQSRTGLAALDATTGNVLPWDPNAGNYIQALAISGTTIYAGGQFGSFGGQSRRYIAAVDAISGNVLPWDPNANSIVWTLVVSGATVYAGGYFDSIGGQSRKYIAALDATTGNALAWNPNATGGYLDNNVYSLAVSGATVYVGGTFKTIGGQSRNNIAALDATTGYATAWNPNANSNVLSVALSGITVFAGGFFTSIGGSTRNNIAALDATKWNALAWNPNADSAVYSLAVSGTSVYAAGNFTSVGGIVRNHIAALDATTGNPTVWNPNADSVVRSLAINGTTIYAGGNFTKVGGEVRNHVAALDASSGKPITWNPNADSTVYSLLVNGSTVYAGGGFTSIGGQSRSGIAALDATTGNALVWTPNAIGSFTGIAFCLHDFFHCFSAHYSPAVYSIALSGTTVFIGGDFSLDGQTRSCIAALDATTGNALAWNPNVYDPPLVFGDTTYYADFVYSLAVSGTTVYAGGDFKTIGGQSRNYIAALDTRTGNATVWNPNASVCYGCAPVPVYSLVTSGTTIYAGGNSTSIGQGVGHPYFAQFDSSNQSPVVKPISASSSSKIAVLQITGSASRSSAFLKFTYSLPSSAPVSLRLYKLNGQLQSELVNKYQSPGNYSLSMQRGKIATGAYLVSFKAGDFHQEKMISLMK